MAKLQPPHFAYPASQSAVRPLLLMLGGAAITTLCAFIKFPLQPVPVTLQTFGVILAALLLGRKLGSLSQLLYVGMGMAGLPVLSSIPDGLPGLTGPTGGYLVGFIAVAPLVGYLADLGWSRTPAKVLAVSALGSALILAFGFLGLMRFMPADKAFAAGVLPFVVGDSLKCVALAILVPSFVKTFRP